MTERELKQLALKISAQLPNLTNEERERLFALIRELDELMDRWDDERQRR
jgi:hypothetical protein